MVSQSRKNVEQLKNILFPILFFVFGILMLIFVRPESKTGIPDYITLKHTNGRISSVYCSEGKSPYIEFHFKEIDQLFYYSSKGDGFELVCNSLKQAMQGMEPINLLYDSHSFKTFFGQKDSYDVWQIDTVGKSIRSFSDISAAYEVNNRVGQIMWESVRVVFLFMGVLTGYAFWKKYIPRNTF
jgi:hypothetical protein